MPSVKILDRKRHHTCSAWPFLPCRSTCHVWSCGPKNGNLLAGVSPHGSQIHSGVIFLPLLTGNYIHHLDWLLLIPANMKIHMIVAGKHFPLQWYLKWSNFPKFGLLWTPIFYSKVKNLIVTASNWIHSSCYNSNLPKENMILSGQKKSPTEEEQINKEHSSP